MQITTLDQYQALAIRTMKVEDHKMMVLHSVMGMMGEAGELIELHPDAENERVGELGDCLWYVANLFDLVGVSTQDAANLIYRKWETADLESTNSQRDIMLTGCRLIDYVKKSVFYSKGLDYVVLTSLASKYLESLLRLCMLWNVEILDAATANIKKLEKRYPDLTFNASHATNRDSSAEMKAAGLAGTTQGEAP